MRATNGDAGHKAMEGGPERRSAWMGGDDEGIGGNDGLQMTEMGGLLRGRGEGPRNHTPQGRADHSRTSAAEGQPLRAVGRWVGKIAWKGF